MLGSCPGTQAEIRLSYFPEKQNKSIKTTDWVKTHSATDYTHQWKLENLSPGLRYAVVVEARPVGDSQVSAVIRGHFQTAPSTKQEVPIKFCLTTCHDFLRRDNAFQGHKIYPSMEQENPDFVIHAGDIEYYDKPLPWALTKELMRFKWSRIFRFQVIEHFIQTILLTSSRTITTLLRMIAGPVRLMGRLRSNKEGISSTTNSFQPPKKGSQPSIGARICKSGYWKVEISGAQTTLTMDQRRAS